jgi:hypothetical protein
MILSLLLSFFVSAQAGQIHCKINDLYPEMWVVWDASQVTATVHSPSYESMPQFEAPLSPNMLPLMNQQVGDLKGLGTDFAFRWEKTRCQFAKDDPWLVSSDGKSEQTKGSSGIDALLFTTAHIDENSLSGKNSLLRLRFIFQGKGGMYFSALPFPTAYCSVTKDSQKNETRAGAKAL